jgi:hypothetical protein
MYQRVAQKRSVVELYAEKMERHRQEEAKRTDLAVVYRKQKRREMKEMGEMGEMGEIREMREVGEEVGTSLGSTGNTTSTASTTTTDNAAASTDASNADPPVESKLLKHLRAEVSG